LIDAARVLKIWVAAAASSMLSALIIYLRGSYAVAVWIFQFL
jgi:hypothetical protein